MTKAAQAALDEMRGQLNAAQTQAAQAQQLLAAAKETVAEQAIELTQLRKIALPVLQAQRTHMGGATGAPPTSEENSRHEG